MTGSLEPALVSWKSARVQDLRPKASAGHEAEQLAAERIAASRDRLLQGATDRR